MEYKDPNFGICVNAADVMAWQMLAATELTPTRARAMVRADRILGKCERCRDGSLLREDPTKVCMLAGIAIEFTSLGPEVPD